MGAAIPAISTISSLASSAAPVLGLLSTASSLFGSQPKAPDPIAPPEAPAAPEVQLDTSQGIEAEARDARRRATTATARGLLDLEEQSAAAVTKKKTLLGS